MESTDCQYGHQIEVWRGREICINCGIEQREYEVITTEQHDKFCPTGNKHLISPITCTFCQAIRKARNEERQSFVPDK